MFDDLADGEELASAFDLTDVSVSLTLTGTGDTIRFGIAALQCEEGRGLTISDEWATDRLNYRFAFHTPNDPPPEMEGEETYVRIEGRHSNGTRLCIRGIAWPWYNSVANEIDGQFDEPPTIEIMKALPAESGQTGNVISMTRRN